MHPFRARLLSAIADCYRDMALLPEQDYDYAHLLLSDTLVSCGISPDHPALPDTCHARAQLLYRLSCEQAGWTDTALVWGSEVESLSATFGLD